MSDIALISKADLVEFTGISKNLSKEKIEPYVIQAQQSELRQFIGHEFYYDLISSWQGDSFSGGTQSNLNEAWNGESYDYADGRTRQFYGLKMCLIYWSYARILESIDFFVSAYGNRLAQHDNSERATRAAVKQKANEARAMAEMYASEAQVYFDKKKSTYTLWNYSTQKRRGTIKIIKSWP